MRSMSFFLSFVLCQGANCGGKGKGNIVRWIGEERSRGCRCLLLGYTLPRIYGESCCIWDPDLVPELMGSLAGRHHCRIGRRQGTNGLSSSSNVGERVVVESRHVEDSYMVCLVHTCMQILSW